MANIQRSEDEIQGQIDEANETFYDSRWAGMSYEQGVDAALRWVIGETDEKPMEE